MSGGTFEYNQYRIRDIADRVEREIYNSGREKTPSELKQEKRGYYDPTHTPDPTHYEYPEEVINEFKKAYALLRMAEIYAHRIDWLLAGDDGEETFLERLKDDLDVFGDELEIKKQADYKPEYFDEEED
jgi:hypothetical protein